jgi:hypothetical protein
VLDENGIDVALEASEEISSQILAPVSSEMLHDSTHTLTGQMKYLYRIIKFARKNPKIIVKTHAPIKPSTVFLGEILMS